MSGVAAQEHGVSAPAYTPLVPDAGTVDDDRTENPPDYIGPRVTTSTSPRPEREIRRMTPSTQRTVEHTFTLSKGSQQPPWLTLKLHSYAVSSASTPTFLEGNPVTGVVELDVEKPDDIKDITITVSKILGIWMDLSNTTLTL